MAVAVHSGQSIARGLRNLSVYKYILDRPCKYTYDKHMIIKIHPEVYVLCKKLIKGSEREREI